MAEKMAIVAFSGAPDRLLGMAMVCSGAIAQDVEVDIYLMLHATHACRKDVVGTDPPFSENDDLRSMIEKNRVDIELGAWYEILADLKEMGELRIHVCSTAPKLMGVTLDDLIDIVDDEVGALKIVSAAQEADVHFFI